VARRRQFSESEIASLNVIQSFGHLPVITGYFYGIIHSINGVLLVLITYK